MADSRCGFTLVELMVSVAIIAVITAIAAVSFSAAARKTRDTARIAGAKQIQTALNLYYLEHDYSYPNTGGVWRSECVGAGGYANKDVAPGLVPTYMDSFPTDPRINKTNNKCCYLYQSDGTDYAILIGHVCSDVDYRNYPTFADPARDSGSNTCAVDGNLINAWSWKIYTPGAKCW